MKIEICIPAFNEAAIIAESSREVVHVFHESGKDAKVTVIDNASTDDTARVAGAIEGVSVLKVPARGKGAAVIGAARQSSADIFGFIDADLSVSPEEAPPLIALIESDACDIAIGSRLVDPAMVNRGIFRGISSKVFNAIRKRLIGIQVRDTQCGLKLMNERGREVLARCEETGWFFDVEFLARAEHAGLRIREVPVRWHEYRFPGRRSKLKFARDTLKGIQAMFRIRKRLLRQ